MKLAHVHLASFLDELEKIAISVNFPPEAYHQGVLAIDHPNAPPAAIAAYRDAKLKAYTPQVMSDLHAKQLRSAAAKVSPQSLVGTAPAIPSRMPAPRLAGFADRARGALARAAAPAKQVAGAVPSRLPGFIQAARRALPSAAAAVVH